MTLGGTDGTDFQMVEVDITKPTPGGMQIPKKHKRSVGKGHTKATATNL